MERRLFLGGLGACLASTSTLAHASPPVWACTCCGTTVLNSQEIELTDEQAAQLAKRTYDNRFGQLKSGSHTHGVQICKFENDTHVTVLARYRDKHYAQSFELFNEKSKLWKPLWDEADMVTRAVLAAQTQHEAHILECLLRKFVP